MDCTAFESIPKHADNSVNGNMCDQINKPSCSTVTAVNDVIFYIYDKGQSAPSWTVYDGCEATYGPTQINDARKYLQDIMINILEKTDDDTAIALGKERRKSGLRSKAWAMINDIDAALKSLGPEIVVTAADLKHIPKLNPESMLSTAVES